MNISYNFTRNKSDKYIDDIANIYYKDIHKYCLSRFYNGMDSNLAEDCTQETFIVLLDKIKKGETVDNPRAFLYRVADNIVNRAISQHMKQCKIHLMLEDVENINSMNLDIEGVLDKILSENINQDELIIEILSNLSDREVALYTMYYKPKICV